MTKDRTLHTVSGGSELAEYHLEFGRDGAPTFLTLSFTGKAGRVRFRFRAPHPLDATFAITDDASGVQVFDAQAAQREHQKIRVEFLTGEGQRSEFWAESVEYDT